MKCHLLSKFLLFFFLALFFSLFLVSGEEAFPEKSVLLEFKSSVSDPYGILSSWNPGSSNKTSHCSWFGVTCNSKSRVISLNITGGDGHGGNSKVPPCSKSLKFPFFALGTKRTCSNHDGKLKGKLSPSIGKLNELRVLSLPNNEFSGEIPMEIRGLDKLLVLDLEGNLVTGKLPDEFAGLKKLRVLNLGFNRLDGEIPISLSNSVSMEILNLAGNMLTGSVPGFLVSFLKLRELNLANNWLNGTLPGGLGSNCRYLEHLDLSGNFLAGGIPLTLGNCQQLRVLLLFSNMLTGVIPRKFGQLRRLEVLDVSRNFINGAVPAELGNCVELSVLILSNLFETQPEERYKSKKVLDGSPRVAGVEYNHFVGSLPAEVTTLPKLRILWAPGATLKGKLPTSWGDCESLEMVNLAQNGFYGQIKGAFQRCKKLYHLDLSSNRLRGELDKNLPVPCMTVFDVSHNLLSGPIPRFDYNVCSPSLNSDPVQVDYPLSGYAPFFTRETRIASHLPFAPASLAVIHNFGGNNFTGQIRWLPVIPERYGKQIDYAFLASGNTLTGSFPGSLFRRCGELNGMIANVSKNKLSGHIPLSIGAMCRSLRFLDASDNEISGYIPPSLGNLRSLITLDFSGNRLWGQIPSRLYHLRYLKQISLSGNNLTGAIPSGLGKLRSLEVLRLSSNSLSGEIPRDIVLLKNLTVLLLDNNNFSGQIPSGLFNVASLSTVNVSLNNLSGPFPLFRKVAKANCGNAPGNPYPISCHRFLQSTPSDSTVSNDTSSPGSKTGFNSIEIASIASASAIVSVLLALVVLFFYTRKRIPMARVQVSEPKEITTFVDIVAIKKLAVGRFQGVQQFHAEIKALGRVRHPNLVTLIGYHASETEMFLIYNYLPGGNLEDFIKERSTREADVYSYGVVLLELISDKKPLDPSFSSHENGFNIVSWACMLLKHGQAKEVFTTGLWDSGPHDDLVDMLYLAVTCTVDSLSSRPTMRQVVQRLKRIQPS
ncbi:LEUCINE-RICH REPEAT RECEPTOR-LIKE PROTEIN KINASE FAMILY PROTEIN-RELATED [Salix koriyanagi]|uniref:LEUCINE-RICH REPEAT RECEPTOR-LIKE PROTEIN KINASE FAMILY PROTEIN-RELATED n=1 Tax=Salix koriyanagi TaxID=2511006 RepID=A0A9Q0WJF3_9ROSI|nr:LEUCINE-RICH REPEAT RECEPTOR-LIKE PROTEIN KINASE FAMILY PROTEIN-RELATED [Salix koriyanagi]